MSGIGLRLPRLRQRLELGDRRDLERLELAGGDLVLGFLLVRWTIERAASR